MKFFGLLGICLVVVAAVMAEEDEAEQGKQMIRNMAQSCKTKEKATDADVEQLIKHEMPTTPEAKCFHACMQEQIGIIDAGKYSPEGAIELAKMMTEGDEKKLATATEIAEACRPTANGDRCQLALDIMTCMETEAKKRGVDMSKTK